MTTTSFSVYSAPATCFSGGPWTVYEDTLTGSYSPVASRTYGSDCIPTGGYTVSAGSCPPGLTSALHWADETSTITVGTSISQVSHIWCCPIDFTLYGLAGADGQTFATCVSDSPSSQLIDCVWPNDATTCAPATLGPAEFGLLAVQVVELPHSENVNNLSSGAKAGLAVGLSVGLFGVVFLIFMAMIAQKHKQQQQAKRTSSAIEAGNGEILEKENEAPMELEGASGIELPGVEARQGPELEAEVPPPRTELPQNTVHPVRNELPAEHGAAELDANARLMAQALWRDMVPRENLQELEITPAQQHQTTTFNTTREETQLNPTAPLSATVAGPVSTTIVNAPMTPERVPNASINQPSAASQPVSAVEWELQYLENEERRIRERREEIMRNRQQQ